MRSCVCSLFHLASGNEDGRVQLVYKSTCCLAWGVIFDRRKDRGVVCVFSILNAGGSVCGYMCVYLHTHAHTAQMGYSDVSPGVGMRHLEGPKNADGLNLGIHILVYVYKVHMCKRRENVENENPILEHRLVSSQLRRAMNWVERLHTSADERVLSGRRAVVIA